jgi:hypothetical protein
MRTILFFLVLSGNLAVLGQRYTHKIKLPPLLNEISGLAIYNDSILMAINDSGNQPELFFLKTNGKILKKTHILSTNSDWEDLTTDSYGNLYIGDVGNNSNDRKDLHFIKLSSQEAFENDTVTASEIRFTYEDQDEFPPPKWKCRFNCEAIFWFEDSLYLLTKNESVVPKKKDSWNRNPKLYVLSDQPGTYTAHLTEWISENVFRVKNSGISDLITAAVVRNDQLYILTYSHLFISEWKGSFEQGKRLFHKRFVSLKQREALTVGMKGKLYIGAEKHPLLGGPCLYILNNYEP